MSVFLCKDNIDIQQQTQWDISVIWLKNLRPPEAGPQLRGPGPVLQRCAHRAERCQGRGPAWPRAWATAGVPDGTADQPCQQRPAQTQQSQCLGWANGEQKYTTDSQNRFVKRLYDAKDEMSTPLSDTECKLVCQHEKKMTWCRINCNYV